MYNFLMIFMFFFIYSFIGWIVEVIDIFLIEKTLVNRGFLIGPYCPIYGISCIIMLVFLDKYTNDPFVLFMSAILICTIVEYLTSYIMEKIFKTRWWDYSNMPFNVNGRICLINSILFGVGGLVLLYVLNPFITSFLNSIPTNIFYIISTICLIIFLIDFLLSFKIIIKLEKSLDSLKKDSTVEISKKVKSVISNSSIFLKRIFKAFPDLKLISSRINNQRKNLFSKFKKQH